MNISDMTRNANGQLPAYTFVGAYTMIYLTRDYDVLCAACASNPDTDPPAKYADVYYEGPPEFCAECNAEIPSAYGDPDADATPGTDDMVPRMLAGDEYTCSGWACVDCTVYLANGDVPADLSEKDARAFVANIDARNVNYRITLGMLAEDHADGCPRKAGDKDIECDCETNAFSWSPCDVCGSNLGGERHAVSFWRITSRGNDTDATPGTRKTLTLTRDEFLDNMSANGDEFPEATIRNVIGANGTWVADGSHALSRYDTATGEFQVQYVSREGRP